MINSDPNMSRKQIFTELPLPSQVKEVTNVLIYKALFIVVKLLLDSRLNLVKISEGKKIGTRFKEGGNNQRPGKKPDNPIKGLDVIKIDDKPVTKVDDSTVEKPSKLTEGDPKAEVKESKDTPVDPPNVEEK